MDLAYIATAFLLVQGTKKKESRAKNLETEIGVILASPRKRSKNWDCNTQWKVLAAHCNVPTRQSQLLEKNPTSRILLDSIPCRKGPTRSSNVRSSFGGARLVFLGSLHSLVRSRPLGHPPPSTPARMVSQCQGRERRESVALLRVLGCARPGRPDAGRWNDLEQHLGWCQDVR